MLCVTPPFFLSSVLSGLVGCACVCFEARGVVGLAFCGVKLEPVGWLSGATLAADAFVAVTGPSAALSSLVVFSSVPLVAVMLVFVSSLSGESAGVLEMAWSMDGSLVDLENGDESRVAAPCSLS